MIPKIIHYCWFGGKPLPELACKCIESWKKYCPDYEIKRWDETNFDLDYNHYVREAYDAQKWAFVTDVVRLYALVNEGGIYMDTDVEVFKPLDDFLKYEAFSGFESSKDIPTGIMASEKDQALLTELLNEYNGLHFLKQDGTYDDTTNVIRITNTCLKYGFVPNNQLQTVKGFTLFPKDYFCPKDCCTWKVSITNNTHTFHHFDGSWLTDEQKMAKNLREKYKKYLPLDFATHLARFIAIRHSRGMIHACKEAICWMQRRKI